MKVSANSVEELVKSEAIRLHAYKDQAGLPTIGIGHLLKENEKKTGEILIDGQPVKWRKGITRKQAVALCASDLGGTERAISEAVKVPLNQNQFDALASLVFNIGVGAFGKSTLLRKLNEGNYVGAGLEFAKWNKITVDGVKQVSAGLVNRRRREADLWAWPV